MNKLWRWYGVGLIAIVSCSEETAPPRPSMASTPAARPSPATEQPAGNPAPTTITSSPADAGAFSTPTTTVVEAGQPLRAHVQVNGADVACGACAVVLAQVQGGTQPYTYSWSDASLQGPGPHRVCPDTPTEYSVKVTDSSASLTTPEFSSTTQQASASGKVECKAPNLDAGQADFIGCNTAMMMGEATTCETGDGGYYSGTGMLPMPLLAGRTYNLSYDQLIPIVIGEPVVVDVYGSNEPCKLEEKLTSWTLDGTWHHPGCFTPTRNFKYLLIRVYVGAVLFYLELLSGATFCAGCNEG